ncbi:TetR family transcriptional regulator [Melittangium boletus DSM 14713]|uniref:TetR family transcriptional regulator n=2 Tax=Melittangium boletus TaxID=83453 RepID=A0A250IT74_9BACT|nr:TetR family transcriptional regulator [Melittangium boletus DSM 14713]
MREEARATILDAAEQVLAEQGLASTRMEDIAARVGVSVGTLYNYFEDRQALLQALLDAQGQELLARIDAELERSQGAPYRTRLPGLLRAILEHVQTHFGLFSLLQREDVRRSASTGEDLARHQHLWSEASQRLEQLGQEGIAQGELRPEDARHYPTLLLGMMQSTLSRQVLERQPLPIEEQLGVLLRCFLEGARPRSG